MPCRTAFILVFLLQAVELSGLEPLGAQPSSGIPAQASKMPRIRVADAGTHFVAESGSAASDIASGATPNQKTHDAGGLTFRPQGFNYDHDADGRLIEDYWHTEWDRVENDFRDMQKLGANVVRVHLQFGKFMKSATEADPAELQQLARLVALAEECNLYLDLTGLGCYHRKEVPDWFDALPEKERWDSQAEFWKAVASVCRTSNSIFCYNLMNEPVIGGEQAAKDWLGPAFGGKHFVQFVAKQTNGRQRHDVAKQWIDRMAAAVREVDDRHLVTVGFVDWSLNRPGLTSGFDPKQVAENLDFVALHLYPESGKVHDAIETLEGFQVGKPVIVEETFPLKCSMEEMASFMKLADSRSSGWISFYWGKMPDEYDATKSLQDAVMSAWLKQFTATFSTASPDGTRASNTVSTGVSVVEAFRDHGNASPDGRIAFSIDKSAWDTPANDLPIGVFDSGIGGLTVLEVILNLDDFDNEKLTPGADGNPDFVNERFVYLGDQANMPYGNYPAMDRREFLKELILKDAAFLLGRRYRTHPKATMPVFDKPPVKAIVIACNTATAWGTGRNSTTCGCVEDPGLCCRSR